MSELSNFHNNKTMSSREIAELTGKRHDNVVADIRHIIETLSNTTEMTHLRFQVSTYKDPSMATRSHCRGVTKRYPIIDTTEALRPLDDDKKITLSNSEGHSGQRGRALPRHAGYKSPYRARGYQPIQNWIG